MKVFGPTKVFGIAGWSGSGKTTLLIRLIPVLVRRGVQVATVKHTHHHPAIGDDESRALFAAGVTEVMAASPSRFSLIHPLPGEDEPRLEHMAGLVGGVDLLLVEGFKFAPHPKLEVWDPALGKPMLAPEQPSVVALATDGSVENHGRPVFRRDDVDSIADFILAWPAAADAVFTGPPA
ncbi:MAG: molybdopterin-guanine dinucleotide biosynthesis protein B [Rhodospirillaceae bacterium]|nr:molybdopterin-guanine dinucleotide biosynthesis protein B [Rhodospirillales bacterium]